MDDNPVGDEVVRVFDGGIERRLNADRDDLDDLVPEQVRHGDVGVLVHAREDRECLGDALTPLPMAADRSQEPSLLRRSFDAYMPAVLVAVLSSSADARSNAEPQEQALDVPGQTPARCRVVRTDERSTDVPAEGDGPVGGPEMVKEERDLAIGQPEDRLGDELVPGSGGPEALWLEPAPDRVKAAMRQPVRRWQPQLPRTTQALSRNLDAEETPCRLLDNSLILGIRGCVLDARPNGAIAE